MERNEISIHEVQVYAALCSHPDKWLTNREIEQLSPKVAARTIRFHTRRLVLAGLIDQAEVFPAHRYRFSDKAEKRNPAYYQRLKKAAEVFEISLAS